VNCRRGGSAERSLKNPNIVDHVHTEPVVIERSPLIHVSLKAMFDATNLGVWIGATWGTALSQINRSCFSSPRHHHREFCRRICKRTVGGLGNSVKRLFRKVVHGPHRGRDPSGGQFKTTNLG
jgi:hypothetical protein